MNQANLLLIRFYVLRVRLVKTLVQKDRQNEKEVCVICGSDRVWDKSPQCSTRMLFRLCDERPAQKLLNAAELNQDSVFIRIAIYYEGGVKALFAANILYHNKCLRKYFREYERKIVSIMNNLDKEDRSKDETVLQVFKIVLSSFDIENCPYSVCFVRDKMNKQLTDTEVIKRMLSHNYDGLCFPQNKRNSQMFFSSKLTPEQIVEALKRSTVT